MKPTKTLRKIILNWLLKDGLPTPLKIGEKTITISENIDMGGGKILNLGEHVEIIAKATRVLTFSTTSTTPVDLGLSVSVTLPRAMKVLCFTQWLCIYNNTANASIYTYIVRDTTTIRTHVIGNANAANEYYPASLLTLDLDVPAGSRTYKLQGSVSGGTGYWAAGSGHQAAELVVIAF